MLAKIVQVPSLGVFRLTRECDHVNRTVSQAELASQKKNVEGREKIEGVGMFIMRATVFSSEREEGGEYREWLAWRSEIIKCVGWSVCWLVGCVPCWKCIGLHLHR